MQYPLSTIIVDDSKTDIELLVFFLEQYPEKFAIETKVNNYEDAVDAISKRKYDLSIIDYTLGRRKEWFDIIETVGVKNLGIIVLHTTNANKKSDFKRLQKIKDYLFLAKTINTIEIAGFVKDLDAAVALANNEKPAKTDRYNVGGFILTNEDIFVIEAAKEITKYHTNLKQGVITTSYGLGEVHDALNSEVFIRVHRSYVVNVNHIRKVSKGNNSDGVLYVACGKDLMEVPFSASGRQILIERGFPFE